MTELLAGAILLGLIWLCVVAPLIGYLLLLPGLVLMTFFAIAGSEPEADTSSFRVYKTCWLCNETIDECGDKHVCSKCKTKLKR